MICMDWRLPAAIRRRTLAVISTLLVSAVATWPVVATAGDSGAYEVEIVVFRNLDQRGTTPEVPVPDRVDAGVAPGLATPADAIGLEPAALRLTALAARLRRGPGYQLLYHGGWRQAAPPRAQSGPTPLPAAAIESGLDGTLTLYRERYLHVLLQLSLPAGPEAAGRSWHIRQGRRLRGDALHYFDNPGFGVILAVRPPAGASEPDPAAATDEES